MGVSLCGSMKHLLLTAFFALLSFLPARAQLEFSDSLRISLLTCSPGPDAYERFGHAGLRIQDLREPMRDVTFHYGVFSFNTPHFVYRFVKGETDYQLGAQYTSDFVEGYRRRGLGMTEQWLNLDSAQCQEMVHRLLINYLPENRTYRYSYFFDNCSTRPFHLLNAATNNTIKYDSVHIKAITLRQMVQEKTGTDNWLNFGIALAVALRSDQLASFNDQLFLPDYLMRQVSNAEIPMAIGQNSWYVPLVSAQDTLLTMTPEVKAKIEARDPIAPKTVCTILFILALGLTLLELKAHRPNGKIKSGLTLILANCYDTVLLLTIGLTGIIVWYLNFFSLHPAVDHNLNCFWLLPTHVIMTVLIWLKSKRKFCKIYFGITFALIIVYVVLDWILGQYCPQEFLLLLATLLLRATARFSGLTSK